MYVKLFASILDSSVWAESSDTRVVWVALLAMADRDGFVRSSPTGLARRANVPVAACHKATQLLEAPDLESSNQTWGGRRIERVEGGWQILNYAHYRDLTDSDVRRQQVRDAVRRHRAEKAPVIAGNHPQAHTDAAVEADAEAPAGGAAAAREGAERPDIAPGADLTYAQQITIAVNGALSDLLAGAYTPLVASVQAETANAWQRDGVPIAVALEVIREAVRRYRGHGASRQPRSLRYFDGAVREAWERQRAMPGAVPAGAPIFRRIQA